MFNMLDNQLFNMLDFRCNKTSLEEVLYLLKFKIKELRQSQGLSQDELSKKSNVSRTVISGLESGSTTVTSTITLSKLANALDVSVRDIFFEDDVQHVRR